MTNATDNADTKDAARRERRRAYQRAWYEANREQISVQKAHRYATDPKFRADRIAYAKKNRRKDDWIRWKYGLSQQDFQRMIERQHGLCLICWKKFTRTPCAITPMTPAWCAASSAITATLASDSSSRIPSSCAAPPTTGNSLPRMKRKSCAATLRRYGRRAARGRHFSRSTSRASCRRSSEPSGPSRHAESRCHARPLPPPSLRPRSLRLADSKGKDMRNH